MPRPPRRAALRDTERGTSRQMPLDAKLHHATPPPPSHPSPIPSSNLTKYVEVYCQKVSPQKTPQVIGKLLDLDCNEDFIRNLLNSVGIACPVEELVEQVPRGY